MTNIKAWAREMMLLAKKQPGKPMKRRLTKGLYIGFGISPDGRVARLVIVRKKKGPTPVEIEAIYQAFNVPKGVRKEHINEEGWVGVKAQWRL